jgi:putative transposase
MKKKVCNVSEKVKVVLQHESGVDESVVAYDYNISRATHYNLKSKYSGMGVSQVKLLNNLEDENRKLNQMYIDLTLDNRI